MEVFQEGLFRIEVPLGHYIPHSFLWLNPDPFSLAILATEMAKNWVKSGE